MHLRSFCVLAVSAGLIFVLGTSVVRAGTVGVDGIIGPEWSGVTPVAVTHQEGAATSNFGSPSKFTAGASYNVFVRSDSQYFYIAAQITGEADSSPDNFANFYLDVNPNVSRGSELIFSVGKNGNISGHTTQGGQPAFSTDGFTSSGVSNGVIELAIANANLRGVVSMLGGNGSVVVDMSQTFGYSVAGGSDFGENRLGAASVVPEPLSVAGGISGLSLLALKRRR